MIIVLKIVYDSSKFINLLAYKTGIGMVFRVGIFFMILSQHDGLHLLITFLCLIDVYLCLVIFINVCWS